ncbi:cytochrome oxidase assembly protein ShyY1 [Pseudarthrobacter sp. SLBN-100]
MWKTALKPRWIAGFVFAIVISGVFVLLSQWQFGRSTQPEVPVNPATEQVQPLTETLEPGDFFPGTDADQMVSAQGSYDPAKQVLVPGRLHDGKTGYWVVSAFAVSGAPALSGVAASPQTWIPVARGWVADPADAGTPPSGTIELTGRLLPSEAPVAGTAAAPGQATAVSVAELINHWEVSSYPGFVAATPQKWPAALTSAPRRCREISFPSRSARSRPPRKSTGSTSSTPLNGLSSPASPSSSGGVWSRTTTTGTSKKPSTTPGTAIHPRNQTSTSTLNRTSKRYSHD